MYITIYAFLFYVGFTLIYAFFGVKLFNLKSCCCKVFDIFKVCLYTEALMKKNNYKKTETSFVIYSSFTDYGLDTGHWILETQDTGKL